MKKNDRRLVSFEGKACILQAMFLYKNKQQRLKTFYFALRFYNQYWAKVLRHPYWLIYLFQNDNLLQQFTETCKHEWSYRT